MKITIDLDTSKDQDRLILKTIADIIASPMIPDVAIMTPGTTVADLNDVKVPEQSPAPTPEKKERKGRAKRTTTPAPEPVPELPEESEAPMIPEPTPEPEPAPAPAPAPVVEEAPVLPENNLSYERDIRPLVIELVQHTSLEHTVKLVKDTFGVDSAKAIPADRFEEAIKLFNDEINKG